MDNCNIIVKNKTAVELIEKTRVKFSTLVVLLYSLSVFADLSYFTWDTYPFMWLRIIVKSLKYLAYLGVLVLVIVERRKISVTKNRICCLVVSIAAIICIHILPHNKTIINLSDIMVMADICILLFVFHEVEVKKVFKNLTIIFVLITLPSIVYYSLTRLFNLELPFSVFDTVLDGKAEKGFFYEQRPLGLMTRSWDNNVSSGGVRPCGVFDEPGVIGTFAGLFLGANIQKKPRFNIINVLLFIEGVLSFSLAFYVLAFMLVIIEAIKKGVLSIVLMMLLLLILFVGFINMQFENEQLKKLQSRFDVSGDVETIVVNNRYGNTYEEEYEVFVDKGGYTLFFGEGYKAYLSNEKMYGASIYTNLIYDYGIIGTIVYLFVFVAIALVYGINKTNITFIIMFFANVYQRPYIFNRPYIILFISALCFLNILKSKEELDEKNRLYKNG